MSEGNLNLALWSPPCPLCGGRRFERLAGNDRYGMGLKTAGCIDCGLVQTWPRPTPDAMAAFYRTQYRNYYQAVAAPDAFYVGRFGKEQRMDYTADKIANAVGLQAGMRVLDVGCSEGTLFLSLLRRCGGLALVGVEPSEEFASFARKSSSCTTYESVEALVANGEPPFDLIVVNHVLEHASDPVEFLKQLVPMLRLDGVIYIDVPDVESYERADCLHIAHLFHFSTASIKRVARRAGFAVSLLERHEPPNHPRSIMIVLVHGPVAERPVVDTSPSKAGWPQVQKAGRRLPFYLFRRRVDRIRWLRTMVAFIRRKRRGGP